MLAKDMIIGHRYITPKGKKFKVYSQEEDGGFIVQLIESSKLTSYRKIPPDYEVTSVKTLMQRISDVEFQRLISYIKNKYPIGFQEKERYLNFKIGRETYKLEYKAQRLLSRKPLINYIFYKKYKNGYYAYKLSEVKDFILKGE